MSQSSLDRQSELSTADDDAVNAALYQDLPWLYPDLTFTAPSDPAALAPAGDATFSPFPAHAPALGFDEGAAPAAPLAETSLPLEDGDRPSVAPPSSPAPAPTLAAAPIVTPAAAAPQVALAGLGAPAALAWAASDGMPTTGTGTLFSQTVDTHIDYKGYGSNVPGAPSFSFKTGDSLYFSAPNKTTFNIGVPCSIGYSFYGGLICSLAANPGSYKYSDPVTIGVTMARVVTDNAIYTVEPTLVSAGDAEFSMTGPSATAELELKYGAKANLKIGSFKASLTFFNSYGFSVSRSYESTIGLSLTLANPKAFTDVTSTGEQQITDSTPPAIRVKGVGNDFISAKADLITIAVDLMKDFIPGIKIIDQTINFGVGSISYQVASMPLQAGLALSQTLTLTPGIIQVSLDDYLNGDGTHGTHTYQTGVSGDLGSTALTIHAPSSGMGFIDTRAVYSETFKISTDTGLEGDLSLNIGGPSASGVIFGIPFSIGPLGSTTLFDVGAGLGDLPGLSPSFLTGPAQSTSVVYQTYYGYADVVKVGLVAPFTPSSPLPAGDVLLEGSDIVQFAGFTGNVTITNDFTMDDAMDNGVVASDDLFEEGASQGVWTFSGDMEFYNSAGLDLYSGQIYKFTGGFLDESGVNDTAITRVEEESTAIIATTNNINAGYQLDLGTTLEFVADDTVGWVDNGGTDPLPTTVAPIIEAADHDTVTLTETLATVEEINGFSITTCSSDFVEGADVSNGTTSFNFTLDSGSTQDELILNGATLYDGATDVIEGTLELDDDMQRLAGSVNVAAAGLLLLKDTITIGALEGSGAVGLANKVALTIDQGGDSEFGGIIYGPGSLTKAGSGYLTLEGKNTYTGVTTIDAGLLGVTSVSKTVVSASLASASIVVAKGAKLAYEVDDEINNAYKVSGIISGAGLVSFSGGDDGIIALSGANTFTGGAQIISGIVDVDNDQALGMGAFVMSGGAVRADGVKRTVDGSIYLDHTIGVGSYTDFSGPISLFGDVAVSPSINAGDDIWSNTVTLGGYTLSTTDTGPDTDGGSWEDEALTISGVISGSGGVTQDSQGELILSGANTYSGMTTVSEGTLKVINAAANGVTGVLGGGNVDIAGSYATLLFENDDSVNDSYQITNSISGLGSLVFAGHEGSYTSIYGDNTGFIGNVLITSGIVNVETSGAFGQANVTMSGGGLRSDQTTPLYIANSFTMSGVIGLGAFTDLTNTVVLNGDLTITPSQDAGDDIWSGGIALNGSTLSTSDIGPDTGNATWKGNALTISGSIGYYGGITQDSSGGLILTGNNIYTGGTNVEAGWLTIGTDDSIGSGGLNVYAATVNLAQSYTLSNAVALYGDGTFNLETGATDTLSGAITDGSSNNLGELIVSGDGRLVLSGNNTFTGGAIVTSGSTLELDAPSTGMTGPITVQGGATLQIDAVATVIGDVNVAFGSSIIIEGITANEASVNNSDLLTLSENGVSKYSLQLSGGFILRPLAFPVYNGVKIVGTLISDEPPTLISVLGFEQNATILDSSTGYTVGIGDTAANIEANLTYIETIVTNLTGIASTDAPISVSVYEYNRFKSFLDHYATYLDDNIFHSEFYVADTASDILAALAALNGDSHASIAIASGAGTLTSGERVTAPGFAVKGSSTMLTIDDALNYTGVFAESAGATISISSGDTLALRGPSSAISAYVSGSGTLSITDDATISGGAALSVAKWTIFDSTADVTIGRNVVYSQKFTLGPGAAVTTGMNYALILEGTSVIAGAISGAGALSDAGGVAALLSGATISTEAWLLSAAGTTTIFGDLSYDGSFTEERGAETLAVSPGDTLTLTGTSVLDAEVRGGGTLALAGPTTIASASDVLIANVSVAGGSTTFDKTFHYGGAFTVSGGATVVLAGYLMTLRTVVFDGATFDGDGDIVTYQTTTVSGDITMTGAISWRNTGALTQSGGSVTLGDSSAGDAELTNAATGIYDITGDGGILLGDNGPTITNAGTLEKTGGAGVSLIGPGITNTGTISVESGTLELDGGLSGTGSLAVSFGGTLQIDGNSGSTQTVSFGFGGGTLVLADDYGLPDGLSLTGWSAGDNLDVKGVTDAAYVSGSLELYDDGQSVGALQVGTSYADDSFNVVALGDGYSQIVTGPSWLDAASGNFADAADWSTGGAPGAADSAALAGSGSYLVSITSSTMVRSIEEADSSAILAIAANETLSLSGESNINGQIAGSGTLALTGGQMTVEGSGLILVRNWQIGDTSVTIDNNSSKNRTVSYGGTLQANAEASLIVDAENLILAETASFSGATVGGSGALSARGATTVTNLSIAGTATFVDVGSVTEDTGTVTLGATNGEAAGLTITTSGTWALTGDSGVDLGIWTAPPSSATGVDQFLANPSAITNNGLFEKTDGAGTSLIEPAFTNNAKVIVEAGTLKFKGAVSGTGTDTLEGAATTLEFDATLAASQTIDLAGTNDTLSLTDAPLGYHGSLIENFTTGDQVDLESGWAFQSFSENAGGTIGTLTLFTGRIGQGPQIALEFEGSFTQASFSIAGINGGATTVITHT